MALFLIAVWLIFFNSSIKTSAVPFGLPAGTKIEIKERAGFSRVLAVVEHDLRRANDLRIAGAYIAAQSDYETILLKHPDVAPALFGMAYSLLAVDYVSPENLSKAKTHIENLARQMPGSVWIRLLLTFSIEIESGLNSALSMAAELSKNSPAFAEARLRYADLLLVSGQPDKAIEEAKAAISITEGADARPFATLALALHKMGSIKECSDLVNYALPRFPSQTEFLLLHGFLSEYANDFETAQNNYRKILMLKPGNTEALNAMASLGEKTPPTPGTASGSGLSLRDAAKETAKILLPIIQEYPENLPLREALGRIYLKARLMKEARTQFSEIYAQDFEYPNIRKLLNETSEEQTFETQKRVTSRSDKKLADSLAKEFAALKESVHQEEFDELGRYFVHYGANFKDFFSKHSITKFTKLDEGTFSEKYDISTFKYDNTIYFDPNNRFYAVRSIIEDTHDSNAYNFIPDLFEHFSKKEIGILGTSNSTETAECSGEKWKGAIWVSRNNLELLMQNDRKMRTIYILRLHSKRFPDTGNLCSYVPMIKGRSKMPR